MRKNIILIIAALLMVLTVIIYIIFRTNAKNITISIDNLEQVNYNNYVMKNSIDYRYGKFIYSYDTALSSVLTVVDEKNILQNYRNIGEQFQLMNSEVVFLKDGNLFMGLNTKTKIATNVDSFVVLENGIIYSALSNTYEQNLYWYDISVNQAKKIDNDIAAYCVDDNRCVTVNSDGWLNVHSIENSAKTIKIDIPAFPFHFMLQGDKIVYEHQNSLRLVNLYSGEKQEISFTKRSHANDDFTFICDKEQIFVSFCARSTNGSIVSDVKDKLNGLWRINLLTSQTEKISDETYDELFLVGDVLFGIFENDVYQISTSTYKSIKIT